MGQGRLSNESGFTLIELLVVVLILGILAAIAIPNFLNQQAKAHDASAKAAVRNAQRAMEEYQMNTGSYFGATPQDLRDLDGSLPDDAHMSVVTPIAGGYAIQVTTDASPPANFAVVRADDGHSTRSCTPAGTGGCHFDNSW